jgi:superoxide dismutase
VAKLTYGWDDHHLNYVTKLRKGKQKKEKEKALETSEHFS